SDGTVFATSFTPTPGIFTIDLNTGASALVGLTGLDDLVGLAFNPMTSRTASHRKWDELHYGRGGREGTPILAHSGRQVTKQMPPNHALQNLAGEELTATGGFAAL